MPVHSYDSYDTTMGMFRPSLRVYFSGIISELNGEHKMLKLLLQLILVLQGFQNALIERTSRNNIYRQNMFFMNSVLKP